MLRVIYKIIFSLVFLTVGLQASYHGDLPCHIVYVKNGVTLMDEVGQSEADCTRLQDRKLYLQSLGDAALNSSVEDNGTKQGCGLGGNIFANPSLLSFDNGIIKDGLNNAELSDFKFDNFNNISGFKCPAYETLPSYKEGIKAEATITNINFYTGDYECVYNFLASKGSFVVKMKNNICKQDNDVIAKKGANVSSIPEFSFTRAYGIYSVETRGAFQSIFGTSRNFFNFGYNLKKEYQDVQDGIDEALADQARQHSFVDINQQLDSHTHFEKTLPSILIGILTGDTSFLNSPALNADGSLNLKSISLNESSAVGTNQNLTATNSTPSFMDTINKKLWGFYYYLMYNINEAFSNIIMLLFGLGTIGVFGFAYVKKTALMNKQNSNMEDFNFMTKFLGVFAAFTIFSAPIIPVSSHLNATFIYSPPNADGSSSVQTQNDIRRNSTIIKTFLQYAFQAGTHWANIINDYAYFSYLTYIEKSYGVYDPTTLNNSFKDDVASLIESSALLKKKVSFFEETCAYNYYSVLKTEMGLPNFYGGQTNGINFIKNNPLGFTKVDYGYCSALMSDIQSTTKRNILDYNSIMEKYKNMTDNLSNLNEYKIQQLNGFIQHAIAFNNNLGWLNVASIPILTKVLDAKELLNVVGDYKNKKNDNVVSSIGEIKYQEADLIKNKNAELFKGDSKKAAEAQGWDNWFANKFEVKSWSGLGSKIWTGMGAGIMDDLVGKGLGWVAGQTLYFSFPGFGEIFKMIYQTHIANAITDTTIGFLSKFAGPGAAILGKIINMGGKVSGWSKKIHAKYGNKTGQVSFSFIAFIIAYLLAVILYTFILTTMTLMFITALIVIKIVFYFIEVLVAVFISLAVMLWSLVFDKKQAASSISQFFYKVMVLSFAPISIVLSVYVYLFASSLLNWIYSLLMKAIYFIASDAQSNIDGGVTIGSVIGQVEIEAVYNIGSMIVTFLTIFLAYGVIFHFYDWVLNYFGHKGEGSVLSKSADSMVQEIKQKSLSKF